MDEAIEEELLLSRRCLVALDDFDNFFLNAGIWYVAFKRVAVFIFHTLSYYFGYGLHIDYLEVHATLHDASEGSLP